MLISFLKDNLREYGFSLFEAPIDADTLIAKVAVQETRNESDVVFHADDADILCLLMYHCKDVLSEVSFKLSKRPMKFDKRGGSKMSMKMLMSVVYLG